jgi:hypothetical protein
LYPDGKNRAVPSLHRDSFLAKVPGPDSYRDCPALTSGNTNALYCRAVRFKGDGWFPGGKNRKTNIGLTINHKKIFLKYFDI